MSTENSQTSHPEQWAEGRDFREAVAQWRLAVRTEVKRVSSLPTAMFDATDPMLEMQLAETTEAMLAQLQMPAPHLTDNAEAAKLRLESIGLEEMRRLPEQIAAGAPGHVDLLTNLAGEYLGVLADSCCTQTEKAQERAAEHICTDFGVTLDNLEEVLQELRDMTSEADDHASRSREQTEIEKVVEQVAEALRACIAAQPGGQQA